MIPAAFDYVRPTSVDECIAALTEHGDEAKILAGGHSLIPLMRLRLATPGVIVDVGRLDDLRGVRQDGDQIVIGALTTHDQVCNDPLVAEHLAVVAAVTATVGDRQVRHRGTLGGAIVHGDSAGDLPTVALMLDAQMVVQGPAGRRTIPASEFFLDYLETSISPEELLIEVRFPKLTGWGYNYQKFARNAAAWAIVGSCAAVRRDNGSIAEARIGLTHMGTTPIRASAVEAALAGAPAELGALREAAAKADEGTNPPSDLNAKPDFRRHLSQVLTRRALEQAIASH